MVDGLEGGGAIWGKQANTLISVFPWSSLPSTGEFTSKVLHLNNRKFAYDLYV